LDISEIPFVAKPKGRLGFEEVLKEANRNLIFLMAEAIYSDRCGCPALFPGFG
jgi:hypothetical protein